MPRTTRSPRPVRDTYGVTSEGTGTARHTLWWWEADRSLATPHPSSRRRSASLRGARLRPEVRLVEVPAPQRIAPYAVALTAEVVGTAGDEEELASGRFVLLHDPSAPEPWDGVWRAVTFARAELEPEVASDPMLGAVGWSWLVDALESHRVPYTAEAGTVTRVVSRASPGSRTARPAWRWRCVPRGPRSAATSVTTSSRGPTCSAPSPDSPAAGGVIALPGQRR